MKSAYTAYSRFCHQLRQNQLLRRLPQTRDYTYDFSTNDYLGFAQHPEIIQFTQLAAMRDGIGSQASRLVASHQGIQDLEQLIANRKHYPSALVFSSGFAANVSVLSALLDPRILKTQPLVFADKLNHASMNMACQMLAVKQHRYRHLDYDHLRFILEKSRALPQPRFILTESVFGMDGDVADLPLLIRLAKQYRAMLYVDEAHATGIFGENGYGLTENFGDDVDISMGTFSKALGSSGAYICCSRSVKRYLFNTAKGLVYSTAPSPANIAAMHKAWELVPTVRNEVQQLLNTAQTFAQQLNMLGFTVLPSTTHIIPILVNSAQKALDIQAFLAQRGIKVAAIRPPSVPVNQSRIRIALSLKHDADAIATLLAALTDYSLTRQINVT